MKTKRPRVVSKGKKPPKNVSSGKVKKDAFQRQLDKWPPKGK